MFVLNDEQRMLLDTVRRFVREQCKPLEDEVETSGALSVDRAMTLHQQAHVEPTPA